MGATSWIPYSSACTFFSVTPAVDVLKNLDQILTLMKSICHLIFNQYSHLMKLCYFLTIFVFLPHSFFSVDLEIVHLFEVTEFSSPNPLEEYTCSECTYYYFLIFPDWHGGSLL